MWTGTKMSEVKKRIKPKRRMRYYNMKWFPFVRVSKTDLPAPNITKHILFRWKKELLLCIPLVVKALTDMEKRRGEESRRTCFSNNSNTNVRIGLGGQEYISWSRYEKLSMHIVWNVNDKTAANTPHELVLSLKHTHTHARVATHAPQPPKDT